LPLEHAKNSRLDQVVSWLAFSTLTAVAAAFAWYVPANRELMMRMFRDFKMELPGSTLIACAVPTAAIVSVAVIAVAGAFVVQLVAASKRSASLFHLLLTAAFVILFLVYREAMGNPLAALIQGISGNSAGK
jgi:hypothetical protein